MSSLLRAVLDSGLGQILTFLGIVVSAWQGPKVVAKVQGKNRVEEIKTEGDRKAEELYINHIGDVMVEYKDQVKGLKEDLEQLRKEFAIFKETHEKEVSDYKKQIAVLELEIENKDNRILELEHDNEEMKIEIYHLKGGE